MRWQRVDHFRLDGVAVIWNDPEVRAALEQGKADFEAGRFYRRDKATGEWVPNPRWPTDGEQPTQWSTNA